MPSPTWTHRDPNPAQSVALGLATAHGLDWSRGDAARALQGLAIETASLLTWFGGGAIRVTTAPSGDQLIQIDPQPTATNPERRQVARALVETWRLLGEGERAAEDYETRATPGETGLPWAAAAAIIVVGVAYAGALAYGAFQAAQVADRKLSRDADAAKLASTHATTLEVLHAHADREQAAGKELPLDEPTRRALTALLDDQKVLAQKQDQPLASGAPQGASSWFGIGFAVAAAAAVALLLK
jgi:hypothetical protein